MMFELWEGVRGACRSELTSQNIQMKPWKFKQCNGGTQRDHWVQSPETDA